MGIGAGTAYLIGSALAAGASVAQSEQQRAATKRAASRSEKQQQLAKAESASEARKQAQENREADPESVDIGKVLESEAKKKQRTRLSGPGGVDPGILRLGQSTLLGE